ncbi:maleylpyruvate isomerase family mycothiol-dependent enzyme [Micromonospora sp. NBC_01796]|uniref:maleylpyruvate isomerase family mycothiol-dependent enzyme n=1 Tax=Micromonospora sp. NBC_01796 TaxID=2975987 RepID=UPI002DDB5E2F|nr:maleylpyruvate isomerase family mycothiol-dependent enzyme [Micromonospora sp. NBC_01796]WSA84495.1 maleylpyruvate isomerase family mycothiol-dependent enzyme [Micromonospora sp. NBC_01796]
MSGAVTQDQWQAARGALRDAGDRFVDLISGARGETPVTPHWTVAQMTAHVAATARLYASMVEPDPVPLPVPGLGERLQSTTVDTVADLNEVFLAHFTERDLAVLGEQLRADIDHILRVTADRDHTAGIDWLGGSYPPLAGILAHLVNELMIHGWDIARVRRVPWEIPPAYAGLYLDLFVMGMLGDGYDHGRLLDNDEPPRERRIAVEFRSRYTTPVTVVLHKGLVTSEPPGSAPDIRLSFNPVTLNLLMFGRVGTARALLSRGVAVTGPRPWLLPTFLRTLRAPGPLRAPAA